MGDKGQKDKNKHNKQVKQSKNQKNEAKKKKQEKAHQQKKGTEKIRAKLMPKKQKLALQFSLKMRSLA